MTDRADENGGSLPDAERVVVIRPDSPLVDAIVAGPILNLRRGRRREPTVPTSAERLQGNRELVASVLDACFWASLAHEEGRPVLTSLTFVGPDEVTDQFHFAKHEPIAHDVLVRLGTVAGNAFKLGIHEAERQPCVWGFLRGSAPDLVTVRFDRPGRLEVLLERAGVICLLEHGRVLRPKGHLVANRWNLEAQLAGLFGDAFNPVLSFLANEMCRHGHGGTLLVVPEESDGWARHVAIQHRVDRDSASLLPRLARRPGQFKGPEQDQLREALRFDAQQAAKQLVSFTKIDGATVIGRSLTLHGFGARITTDDAGGPALKKRTIYVPQVIDAEWSDLGGTRHQSAARFVAATRDSVAFVASHDGRLSALAWRDGRGDTPGYLEWLQDLEALVEV